MCVVYMYIYICRFTKKCHSQATPSRLRSGGSQGQGTYGFFLH